MGLLREGMSGSGSDDTLGFVRLLRFWKCVVAQVAGASVHVREGMGPR